MKALLQLSFLIFYVSSGFAAGQLRTVQLLEELQHFIVGSDAITVDKPCTKVDASLPRYRDVKSASNDLQYQLDMNVELAPAGDSEPIVQQPFLFGLLLVLDRFHSRAPPRVA